MAQRDGSLIRRKQEQWARERADEQNSAWFPFGRPGGGSPNRAFSSRNPEGSSAEVHHPSSYSSSSHTHRHEMYEGGSSHYHRSRSRSRDRSHSRHHRTSRRRSRSADRRPNHTVYVNPNFGNHPPPPSSATYILQENARLEDANATLHNQLYLAEARISALESQLGGTSLLRDQLAMAKEDVERQRIVNLTLESNLRSATLKMRSMEQSNDALMNQLNMVGKEIVDLKGKLRGADLERCTLLDQNGVLARRNEVLAKKCEELVEKTRILGCERDDARHAESIARERSRDIEMRLEAREKELIRAEQDVTVAKEKERMWMIEKMGYERLIKEREDVLLKERLEHLLERKRDQKTIAELRIKAKRVCPDHESHVMYEAMMKAVKTMKEEYAKQISVLTERLDAAEEEGRKKRSRSI